jgi:DNA mismatch endonuclease (patch repair protein)
MSSGKSHNQFMQQFQNDEQRFAIAKVRSKRTRPERQVAAVLLRMNTEFKQNVSSLPGSPDFVIEGMKKAIFVHGCYWHRHGCAKSKTPKTNRDYWIPKFARNVKRDRKVISQLKRHGWLVLVLWECKLPDVRSLFQVLRRFLSKPDLVRKAPRRRASVKAPFRNQAA